MCLLKQHTTQVRRWKFNYLPFMLCWFLVLQTKKGKRDGKEITYSRCGLRVGGKFAGHTAGEKPWFHCVFSIEGYCMDKNAFMTALCLIATNVLDTTQNAYM